MNAREIRRWRRKLRLTQKELAKELGVGIRTIVRWESGESTPSPMAQKLIEEMRNILAEVKVLK